MFIPVFPFGAVVAAQEAEKKRKEAEEAKKMKFERSELSGLNNGGFSIHSHTPFIRKDDDTVEVIEVFNDKKMSVTKKRNGQFIYVNFEGDSFTFTDFSLLAERVREDNIQRDLMKIINAVEHYPLSVRSRTFFADGYQSKFDFPNSRIKEYLTKSVHHHGLKPLTSFAPTGVDLATDFMSLSLHTVKYVLFGYGLKAGDIPIV